jgi:hypothetical protein
MFSSYSEDIAIMLVTIRHQSFQKPVYLSSDPTKILSTDPLVFGTVHRGVEYPFVLMKSIWPDDEKDSPPKTTLSFDNVDKDMAAVIRSIPPGTYAWIDLTLVMASRPDEVEDRYTNMRGVRGSYDLSQVSLDISREPFTKEPWPADRMTVSQFPSIFRQ